MASTGPLKRGARSASYADFETSPRVWRESPHAHGRTLPIRRTGHQIPRGDFARAFQDWTVDGHFRLDWVHVRNGWRDFGK
jgi:hypothetical protein